MPFGPIVMSLQNPFTVAPAIRVNGDVGAGQAQLSMNAPVVRLKTLSATGADPLRWRGMALGAVVDPAQVERIILLRAVTSAPRELDLANLRRILAASAPLRLEAPDAPPPPPWQPRQGIWHALLLMRSGQVFELELHAGDAASPWADPR